VLCFAEAARAGAPGGGCVDVQSRSAIETAILRPLPGSRAHDRLYASR
jgi:hypothetical protein